jgi:hypothetical protein
VNLVENKKWHYKNGYFPDTVYKLARWVLGNGDITNIEGVDETALSAEHHGLYRINLISDKRQDLDLLELIFKDDNEYFRYAVNLKTFEITNEGEISFNKVGDNISETAIGKGTVKDNPSYVDKKIFINMANIVIK